jgi:hypothetical protein
MHPALSESVLAMRLSAFYSLHNLAKMLDPQWILDFAEDMHDQQDELEQTLLHKYNEGFRSEKIVSMTRDAEEFARMRQRLEDTEARLEQHEAEAKHELEQSREELEARVAELEKDVEERWEGGALSYTRIKSNAKLESRLHKFTPFHSIKALDKFLNWINYKGVAERLIRYRAGRCKPNDSSGDAMNRPVHNTTRLLDWKDQFLMTMTYIYSGKWSTSS